MLSEFSQISVHRRIDCKDNIDTKRFRTATHSLLFNAGLFGRVRCISMVTIGALVSGGRCVTWFSAGLRTRFWSQRANKGTRRTYNTHPTIYLRSAMRAFSHVHAHTDTHTHTQTRTHTHTHKHARSFARAVSRVMTELLANHGLKRAVSR